MIVNEGKKCRCVLLVVMKALWQPLGHLSWQKIEDPPSSGTWKTTLLTCHLCYPSRTLELWTVDICLLQSPEVWGAVGGRAHGRHLISAISCQSYLHVPFISDWGVAPSQTAQSWSLSSSACLREPAVPLQWEVTGSGWRGHHSRPKTWKAGSAAWWHLAWRQML